ncbi:Asp23/Gls24 family envelope stress response protein [Cellulomonas septica]|uniref:Asp23/Gls24 family envelope stress response protein n=1 Tax=Cellulomonas septica TaxID=285080 RepID=A0ABX1K333_9CELL|nr:Asp23/Gls24 family envelope stress response protein [Cellulomonas septica]NKY40979.1 Asp23/Gls24 family envelope stress response protein [Cellulomonas septica]
MTESSAKTVTTPPVASRQSALVTPEGTTTIADTVVSKIAGIAASEVSGVHALGGGAARAIGTLRERIPGARTNHSQGVSVEVGETEAAVDLDLVAEYGVSITDLANGIRRNVISAVERMTGLHVVEVNVAVNDVHLPQDDPQPAPPQEQRVQ